MKKDKDIKVSEDLRSKLKILCTTKGYRSYEELINDMLNTYCKINGIEISIKLKN